MKVERVREKDGKLELAVTLDGEEVSKEMQQIAAYEIGNKHLTPDRAKDDPIEYLRSSLGRDEASFVFDEGIMKHRSYFALTAAEVDAIGKPVYRCPEHAQEGKDFTYFMVCVLVPEFELDDYSPVSIVVPSYVVKDEEIEEKIHELARKTPVRTTDTTHDVVEKGDIVELSMQAMQNGHEVEVLSSDSREYRTGSLTMPDEFDEAIIGMKVGETKEFSFAGPEIELNADGTPKMENYDATVSVKRIIGEKEPELDDAWAARAKKGAKNMAGLRKMLAEEIRQDHKIEHDRQAEALAANELAKRFKGDISDLVYAVAVKEARDSLEENLKRENKTMEDFANENNIDTDKVNSFLLMQVRGQLTRQFALNAFAKERGLTVEEEDLDAFFEAISPKQGGQAAADFRREGRMYAARCAALRLKANKLLVEEADVKILGAASGDGASDGGDAGAASGNGASDSGVSDSGASDSAS